MGTIQFMTSCATCHGDMGQGGTKSGINPRLYTQAELARIIPTVDNTTHAACGNTNGCAANTAAYLISLVPKLTNGESKFTTLGTGVCINCHGADGQGDPPICSYVNSFCTSAKSYTFIKGQVEVMGKNGKAKPYLCTATVGGTNCSEDVSLYLMSFGWKRNFQ